ncbi:MAG TPA: hypothetical protein VFQ01_13065 [Nocardioides sp.]|nr:hypothetical protein [Nocardioides sp.]
MHLSAAAMVVLALAVGGCSSSDSSQPQAAPSSSATGTGGGERPVATKIVLGRVAGDVHQPNKRRFKKHRKAVLKGVGRAVDSWLDGAFVGVSYPRGSFKSAFAAFTKPAERDARKQPKLMTNWGLRKKIDGVEVKKRRVAVDVFAPHGRPAGATARVALVFRTTGHTKKRVAVHARLFLNPGGHGHWRIFGYDVARGDR